MRRLRSKFMAVLLVLTLLPAVAIAWFAKQLLDRTLAIGLNTEVTAGLNAALQLVQAEHARERALLVEELRAAAVLLRQHDALPLQLRDHVHRLARVDATGRIRHVWPADTGLVLAPEMAAVLATVDTLSDAGSDAHTLRLVLRLGRDDYLVGIRPLPELFRRHSAAVLHATQYFNVLDLEQFRLRRSLIYLFLAVYAPMVLLSLMAGWYFAWRLTAPLEELGAGTRRLVQGDWQYRAPVRSRDEIGALARAFNAMVEDLRRQQQQVIALEKAAAWREIARVLAHEIKNPLTPIQLMVQQIRDAYSGEEHAYRRVLSECTGIIHEEIDKLRTLVREFSDFARLPELHPAPVQLNDLAVEVTRLHVTRSLALDLDPDLPLVTCDAEAMRRVLINLVENALQASATAEVWLRTRRVGGGEAVTLAVSDNGPGIPTEHLPRVFEPYFSTKKSGMGLGLAIVKRLVEEHGGTITVTSTVGQGATFAITLPQSAGPMAASRQGAAAAAPPDSPPPPATATVDPASPPAVPRS